MAAVPIFDKDGHPVGWLHDLSFDVISNPSGKRLAFIAVKRIFGFAEQFRGLLLDKFICDTHGNPVAFIDGATHGPALPTMDVAGDPPDLDTLPVPSGIPQPLPSPTLPQVQPNWSTKTFSELLPLPTPTPPPAAGPSRLDTK